MSLEQLGHGGVCGDIDWRFWEKIVFFGKYGNFSLLNHELCLNLSKGFAQP